MKAKNVIIGLMFILMISAVSVIETRQKEPGKAEVRDTGIDVPIQNLEASCGSPRVKTFEVNLSPATPANNYQVKIALGGTFPYAQCKADGGDIRFFTIGGIKLSYWIESWNQGTNHTSVLWVKVPTAGTTEIRMTFGNIALASESNGTAVFDFFDDFLGTACNPSVWDVIQHQYTNISVSGGIVSLISSPPSATRSTSIFGFTDTVVEEGGTYTTITTNAVHFGNDVFTTVNLTGGTSIPWGYQDAWKVFDACWIDPTTAQGYVNDTLVGTLTTNIPTESIPIQFIARGMIWGPGAHYAAILRSKDLALGQAGFAMRSKAREYYDYVTTPDANPPEIHVDWVLVRKCSLNEPTAALVQVGAIDAILEDISALIDTLKVLIAENLHGSQLQKCTKYVNAAAALVAQMIEDRESGTTPCRATISELSRYVDRIKDMARNCEIKEACIAIERRVHDLKAIVDRVEPDHHGHCNDDHN